MNEAHIVFGVAAIVVNALAALFGAWGWWRGTQNRWFWRLLRAGQASILVEVVAGGIYYLIKQHAPGLHILYGGLPLAVSFIAEGLRANSAQLILDKHGHESAQAVGRLPADEQRAVVVEILRREMGTMTLAALVVAALLARAWMTG